MVKSKRVKDDAPKPYTKEERERKINLIRIQLLEIDLYRVLGQEHLEKIQEFVTKGTDYYEVIDLPMYSREMIINLINDKRKQTYINLKFKRIRVDEEGDDNKINELNKIQEELFENQLRK